MKSMFFLHIPNLGIKILRSVKLKLNPNTNTKNKASKHLFKRKVLSVLLLMFKRQSTIMFKIAGTS